jgi:hypothetical protein
MKIELYLFLITGFLIYNTYHDGKYTNMIKINIKYVKMVMYAFGALSMYLFFKKSPLKSKDLLVHANDIIKYMPIDKNTSDIMTPLIDFTKERFIMNERNEYNKKQEEYINRQMPEGMNVGYINPEINNNNNNNKKHKRSVSETKKKYVASNQGWKCGHCSNQLDYSYEVDHIKDLQHGGTNEVNNLVALCRNCHGKKTLSNYL